jgi:hypothetical protein
MATRGHMSFCSSQQTPRERPLKPLMFSSHFRCSCAAHKFRPFGRSKPTLVAVVKIFSNLVNPFDRTATAICPGSLLATHVGRTKSAKVAD